MNVETIGKIVEGENKKTLEEMESDGNEDLRRQNADLIREKDEVETRSDMSTSMFVLANKKLRHSSPRNTENLNRKYKQDVYAANLRRSDSVERSYTESRLHQTTKTRMRELQEFQVETALALLSEFNQLPKDEQSWNKADRKFMNRLSSTLDKLGLSIINPQEGDVFDHKQHSSQSVSNDDWLGLDYSQLNSNGRLIAECISPGIQEKINDSKSAITFKRAHIALQPEKK